MPVSTILHQRGRRLAAAGAAALLAATAMVSVHSASAEAATCNTYVNNSSAQASIWALSPSCSWVKVRHMYRPTATGLTYWTAWDTDSTHAESRYARTLLTYSTKSS